MALPAVLHLPDRIYGPGNGDLNVGWEERLARDRRFARLHQSPALRSTTDAVLESAKKSGALAFAVTGSTALDRRTDVSDLDFYVVGQRPSLPDSDEELDLYSIELDEFHTKLAEGDDYLHWTLRFGLVLHDTGPLREAYELARRDGLWPDPAPKAAQARRALEMTEAITLSGDHDAAIEQARIAFSLAARWWLLRERVFPRARRDLPVQLSWTPMAWLGEALWATIFEDPTDETLLRQVAQLREALKATEGPSVAA